MSRMNTPSQHYQQANAVMDNAQREISRLPNGDHSTEVVQAQAARVQMWAQCATVHALLDIADALRAIAGRLPDA